MTKPAVFKDLDWVAYAETSREPHDPLGGNLTDRPQILNEANYELIQPGIPYDIWLEREAHAVHERDVRLRSALGLVSIGYPHPIHGVNTVLFNESAVADLSLQTPPSDRLQADAIATQRPGFGVSISPADCIVMSVADMAQRSVGQIHTGYVGLEKQTIDSAFSQLNELDPSTSRVYISAHARQFPLHGAVLERFLLNRTLNRFIDDDNMLHMADLAIHQLIHAGVPEDNIQVDPRDTFTDPSLFSFRMRAQKGADGRNGIAIGITEKG